MKKLIVAILLIGSTKAAYSTVTLSGSATSYIQLRGSLQSGATFFVSSGTVNGIFQVIGKPDASFGCSGYLSFEPQTNTMAPANMIYSYPCANSYTEITDVKTNGTASYVQVGVQGAANTFRGLNYQNYDSDYPNFASSSHFTIVSSTSAAFIGPNDGGVTWPRFGVFTDPTDQGIYPNKKLIEIGSNDAGAWTDYFSVTRDTTTISNNLILADTVWDDLQVQVSGVRLPAAAAATYTSYKGSEVLTFGKTGTNTIHFNAQTPHRYKYGTNLEFHIHLAYPDGTAGGTVWQMTYSWANINGNFPGVTTTTKTIVSPEVTDRHQLAELIGSIPTSTMTLSAVLLCSLSRLGGDGEDNYDNDVYLIALDFHHQIDTLGSREETSK